MRAGPRTVRIIIFFMRLQSPDRFGTGIKRGRQVNTGVPNLGMVPNPLLVTFDGSTTPTANIVGLPPPSSRSEW